MRIEEELELKTLVTKEEFDYITSLYPNLDFIEQVNTYYYSNNDNSYAFRIRKKEDKKIFTLKSHSNGKLIEYEKVLDCPFELDREILLMLASFGEYPPFKIIGKLTTKRAVVQLLEAELCFDINTYNNNIDYEIEYEVKKEHDYKQAFDSILSKANIQYVPSKSKFSRLKNSI